MSRCNLFIIYLLDNCITNVSRSLLHIDFDRINRCDVIKRFSVWSNKFYSAESSEKADASLFRRPQKRPPEGSRKQKNELKVDVSSDDSSDQSNKSVFNVMDEEPEHVYFSVLIFHHCVGRNHSSCAATDVEQNRQSH